MTYSQRLLDDLRAAQNLDSDNKAAKMIGCTRQHISQVRAGIKNFGQESTFVIAEMTGKDPKEAVLIRLIEDAENPKMRKTYEEIKQRIQ